MTQEEKTNIIKVLRAETGCGLMEASTALDKLIGALKRRPMLVLDNPYQLKITWEQNDTGR